MCQKKFNMSLNEVISKPKTEAKEKFLEYYYFKLPQIMSDCEMNKICRHIEGKDFELKNLIKSGDVDIYKSYIDDSIDFDEEKYLEVKKAVIKYFKTSGEEQNWKSHTQRDLDKDSLEVAISKYDDFKDKMFLVCSNAKELTNYLIKFFYVEKISYNKDFLWNCYGKYIYKKIFTEKNNEEIKIPVICDDGGYNYLFDKFNIEEVKMNG